MIKYFIKKYCYKLVFANKLNKKAKIKNKDFTNNLETATSLNNSLNIFTTNNEDGIILQIISKINIEKLFFIDLGSNDCINSNCANIAFHHNWSGIFIDGDKKLLKSGEYIYTKIFGKKQKRFSFIHTIIKKETIDRLLYSLVENKEIDLISIDLDGNDYYIWKAINKIKPKIVVIEVQVEKGKELYIPDYQTTFVKHIEGEPNGASILSMVELANSKGYELVASNKGFYNLFFVDRNYVSQKFTIISKSDLLNSQDF